MLGRQIIVECRFNLDMRRMAMPIKIKEMIERGPNHLTSGKFTTTGCSRLDRICGISLFELSARDIICGWLAQAIYGKITEI